MTERSRAECRYRQRTPFCLLIPFSSSTPFHFNEKLGCTHAREACVGAEQLGCAPFARAPRFTASQSLCVLITHKTHRLAFVETLLKFRYPRLARVNPRIGAKFRLRPGLWAACRRRAGRAGRVPCKWLRAFTSIYERLRAFTSKYDSLRACSSAPGRVSSRFVASGRAKCSFIVFGHVWARRVYERVQARQVAFSRANFFFVFGHVRARLGVFFRHFSSFLVILRHSSSQNGFFGNGGQRAVAAPAGQGGQQFAAHGSPAQGAGWAKWHGIHLKSVCSCGRAAAALVRLAHKCTTKAGRLQFLEIPGGISEWGSVSDLL